MLHKILSVALLMTMLFIVQVGAQPNTTTVNPSLTIVQPITITKVTDRDLLFGKFAAYVFNAGSVIMGTNGSRTATGSITLIETEPYGAAEFRVEGLADATFNLLLPTTATLSNTILENTYEMVVSDFVTNISGTPQIGEDGLLTFNVGATLTKTTDFTPRGSYTGTFSVTVSYQ